MNCIKVVLLGIFLFILLHNQIYTQKCKDMLVFDGSEDVVHFGIDTTGNWWILTQPYKDEYRLIISGERTESFKEIKSLTFSQDGSRWAFFGKTATNWVFVTSDTAIPLFAEDILQLGFSNNSENYFLAYKNGTETTIEYDGKKLSVTYFNGKVYLNFDGTKIAFVLSYGKMFSLIIPNLFESDKFDEIVPLGFWYDNEFIYAGRKGSFWQIFKNNYALTEEFQQLIDMKINYKGTNAVFVIKRNNYDVVAVVYSEKYFEPIFSKSYDNISNVKLHPNEPLAVFLATKEINKYIVYGNVEYPLGNFATEPFFTFDGSEIYYCLCNIDCYFFVDGKRYTLPGGIACESQIARKPNSSTIAFSSYTSLIMLDYFLNIQYSGMIVDKITPPIYNHRTKRYEALGEINNKIYLLTCEP
ncbi:MAG: hypothetical protein ACP5RR_03475 [Candidatus Kapaibacteriota bacterium]